MCVFIFKSACFTNTVKMCSVTQLGSRKVLSQFILLSIISVIVLFLFIEVKDVFKGQIQKRQLPVDTSNLLVIVKEVMKSSNANKLSEHADATVQMNTPNIWDRDIINDIFRDSPTCLNKSFLLVLVVSSPVNFDFRDAIRKTWALPSKKNESLATKILFLIGYNSNRFLQALIENEQREHQDILQGDYKDSYRNLTLKVLDGLRWAANRCPSQYLLKTDDDCFVNVFLLNQLLRRRDMDSKKVYIGRVRQKAKVVRNPRSPWYLPTTVYTPEFYPPYVSGGGYVLSRDAVVRFVNMSFIVQPFPNEDAYVGHVLNLCGLTPRHSARFVNDYTSLTLCNFSYVVVIHGLKPDEQYDIHRKTQASLLQCQSSIYYDL